MSKSVTSMKTNAAVSPANNTRLHGSWLRMARIVWIGLALFFLGVSVASQPVSFTILHHPCMAGAINCNGAGLLTASQVQGLPKIGLSLDTYVWYIIVISGLSELISFVLGCIFFWRRSDDWMVLLVTMMFISIGATGATNVLEFGSSLWSILQDVVVLIESVAIFLTLALFPNGRFVPRWTRWVILVYPVGYTVFYLVFLNWLRLPGWLLFGNPVNGPLFLGSWILLTLAQLYRYFRVSTPIEKQQTKWVAFTFFILLVLGIVGLVWPTLLSFVHNGFLYLFMTNVGSIIFLFIPLSICIAILRHRLYEIDRIINRTLVYGLLTALLAGVYIGLIIGLQALLRGITRQNNDVAIVISTLAIFALFEPLRRRIQRIIDRRFYRRKYDAARTIAAFSATLRGEVDLDELREHLLAVVQETMQPRHVSLWLRPPERTVKHQPVSDSNPQDH